MKEKECTPGTVLETKVKIYFSIKNIGFLKNTSSELLKRLARKATSLEGHLIFQRKDDGFVFLLTLLLYSSNP